MSCVWLFWILNFPFIEIPEFPFEISLFLYLKKTTFYFISLIILFKHMMAGIADFPPSHF